MANWVPGQLKRRNALEEPYENVPQHLRGALWDWIDVQIQYGGFMPDNGVELICMTLRIRQQASTAGLKAAIMGNDEALLNTVEIVLEYAADHHLYGADTQQLQQLLDVANSAYRVRTDGEGLELRVTEGVRDVVESATRIDGYTGSAGEHLTNAWNFTYGLKPSAPNAYKEAVLAVEAAMAERVSPDNKKQTLGTMIRDIAAKPSKWRLALPDAGETKGVETVLAMMRLLWAGQTRHAGTSRTRTPLEDARARTRHRCG